MAESICSNNTNEISKINNELSANTNKNLRNTKLQQVDTIDPLREKDSTITKKYFKNSIKSKRKTKSIEFPQKKFKVKFSYSTKAEVKNLVQKRERDSSGEENFLDTTEPFDENMEEINIVNLLKSKPSQILKPTKPPRKSATKKRIRQKVLYDIDALKVPFSQGWKRLIVIRKIKSISGKESDTYYFTPNGQKIRSLKNVEEFINSNSLLSVKNFCFNPNIIIGVGKPHEIQRHALEPIRKIKSRQTTSSRRLKSKSSTRKRKSSSSVPVCQRSKKSFKTVFAGSIPSILEENVLESNSLAESDCSDSNNLLEEYVVKSFAMNKSSRNSVNKDCFDLVVLYLDKKESTELDTLAVTEDTLEFYSVFKNEDLPPVQSASDQKPPKPPFPLFQIRYEDLFLSDEEFERIEQ